jgi:uncharacterized protein Veg
LGNPFGFLEMLFAQSDRDGNPTRRLETSAVGAKKEAYADFFAIEADNLSSCIFFESHTISDISL